MNPPSLRPQCSFERLDPMDVSSAIKTNSVELMRSGVIIARLGLGYEAFLSWAVQDVQAATSAEPTEQMRFSVSAVMNARRRKTQFT